MIEHPEQKLWQAVVFQAAYDATNTFSPDSEESRAARRWFKFGGDEFRKVCLLAGMDADFVLGAYREGRINFAALRSAANAGERQ